MSPLSEVDVAEPVQTIIFEIVFFSLLGQRVAIIIIAFDPVVSDEFSIAFNIPSNEFTDNALIGL